VIDRIVTWYVSLTNWCTPVVKAWISAARAASRDQAATTLPTLEYGLGEAIQSIAVLGQRSVRVTVTLLDRPTSASINSEVVSLYGGRRRAG
jgi:hypothetical protein